MTICILDAVLVRLTHCVCKPPTAEHCCLSQEEGLLVQPPSATEFISYELLIRLMRLVIAAWQYILCDMHTLPPPRPVFVMFAQPFAAAEIVMKL